jgi:hypothetical protein
MAEHSRSSKPHCSSAGYDKLPFFLCLPLFFSCKPQPGLDAPTIVSYLVAGATRGREQTVVFSQRIVSKQTEIKEDEWSDIISVRKGRDNYDA